VKRLWALLAVLLMLNATASAAGLAGLISEARELPDPASLVGVKPVLYEKAVQLDGAAYTAYTFPMPEDLEGFLSVYSSAAQRQGYTVSKGAVLDQPAWMVSAGALKAWLVPDYRGSLLFLVHTDLEYAPLPTPTPSRVPAATRTPAPDRTPASTGAASGGHWEIVKVKKDCDACIGGICDLCNGSGWYHQYGERVPCWILCQTCDGLGYWMVSEMRWVP